MLSAYSNREILMGGVSSRKRLSVIDTTRYCEDLSPLLTATCLTT
jgi:hypothetical protein